MDAGDGLNRIGLHDFGAVDLVGSQSRFGQQAFDRRNRGKSGKVGPSAERQSFGDPHSVQPDRGRPRLGHDKTKGRRIRSNGRVRGGDGAVNDLGASAMGLAQVAGKGVALLSRNRDDFLARV